MRFLILAVAVAGCGGATYDMRGALSRQVTVGPSTFNVYSLGDRAQAVRVNAEAGRKARGVMARGYVAIERGSGCRVVPGTYSGDPAVMTAKIDCDVES